VIPEVWAQAVEAPLSDAHCC